MSGPSRYVLEAMRRRVDAGLCPVCGGKLVAPLSLGFEPSRRPAVCVYSRDGRHPAPARTKMRMKKIKVKLQLPPGAS